VTLERAAASDGSEIGDYLHPVPVKCDASRRVSTRPPPMGWLSRGCPARPLGRSMPLRRERIRQAWRSGGRARRSRVARVGHPAPSRPDVSSERFPRTSGELGTARRSQIWVPQGAPQRGRLAVRMPPYCRPAPLARTRVIRATPRRPSRAGHRARPGTRAPGDAQPMFIQWSSR
jgi:hypothetical protein